MMLFEISAIVFFIKKPSEYFDIIKYVSFCSHHTRSSSHFKLRHSLSKKNSVRHFRIRRLEPQVRAIIKCKFLMTEVEGGIEVEYTEKLYLYFIK